MSEEKKNMQRKKKRTSSMKIDILRKIMDELNILNAVELSKRLDISYRTLTQWQNKGYIPSPKTVIDAFPEVSREFIFTGQGEVLSSQSNIMGEPQVNYQVERNIIRSIMLELNLSTLQDLESRTGIKRDTLGKWQRQNKITNVLKMSHALPEINIEFLKTGMGPVKNNSVIVDKTDIASLKEKISFLAETIHLLKDELQKK